MGGNALVGLARAAQETGRSREWLRRLIERGEIAGAQRVGNSFGIPQQEVDRLKATPKRPGGWPKGRPRKQRPDPPAAG